MTNMELYVRLLTELSYDYKDRRTFATRSKLQDVLCELRDRASAECGDVTGQHTQDEGEYLALLAIRRLNQSYRAN